LLGIEVKSGGSGTAKGMTVFQKKFNPDKVLLIGNIGLSWQDLLKMNPVNLFNRDDNRPNS
jgi:hypothetical protein